MVRYAAVNHMT